MRWKFFGRRFAAAALALSLTVGAAGVMPAEALSEYYTQYSGWAAADLQRAEDMGLLMSYYMEADLKGNITRHEFAVLAAKVARELGLTLDFDVTDCPFTDLPYKSRSYVAAAWKAGLINGVSATEFDPYRTITRMEVCTLVSRIMDKCGAVLPQKVGGVAQLLDSGSEGSIPAWAKQGVIDIVGAGLMEGYGGSLHLRDSLSREEAVVLILRSLDQGSDAQVADLFTEAEWAEIEQLRALADFGYSGSAYAQIPSSGAPYAQGSLNDAFLQNGLNAVNYVRALAGLDAVTLSASKNDAAQAGALLLAASNYSHYPSQPADMSDELYAKGYAATSTSNIGSGYYNLSEFTLDCIDDSQPSNITGLGHRRWLLDPTLTSVGMGYVEGRCTTQVVDSTFRSWQSSDQDYVLWPSAGLFPSELFHDGLAWSCSLNPSVYSSKSQPTITVTDGRGNTWSRTAAYGQIDLNDFAIMDVSIGYGGSPCIIFVPSELEYAVGETITVEISGLYLQSGAPNTITYTVKLFE